jgi:methyl-accepting chemotaxis protein
MRLSDKLNTMKLKYKLGLIAALALLGIFVISLNALFWLKGRVLDEKQIKTRHVVETAYGVLEYYYKLQKEGSMTEKDAKTAALMVVKGMRYDENEYFWINDMHPTMIMHPIKPELDGKDLSDFKDPHGLNLFVAFVETVQKEGKGFVTYLWPKPGHKQPVPKLSYVKGFGPWGWIIGSGIYLDNVNAAFWSTDFWGQAKEFVLLVAIITICILGFAYVVNVGIEKQLGAEPAFVVNVVRTVSKGDLNVSIETKEKDKTSLLAAMKEMTQQLKTMIGDIKSASASVSSGSEQLSSSSAEISRGMSDQAGKATQIATSSEEMSQTIIDVAKNAAELAASASTATEIAKEGEGIVDKSVYEVKAIAGTVSESSRLMKDLGERSKQIGQIVNVINGIADQTNLLALNAAIEAARAGEQGRGFAVVANEVRQLAERTAKATSEISSMVKGIQDDVEGAVVSMDGATKQVSVGVELSAQAGEALRKIVKSVGDLQGTVQQMASSTEEMSSASEAISGDIQTIASNSKEITSGAYQIAQASSDLARVASSLEGVVGQFKI